MRWLYEKNFNNADTLGVIRLEFQRIFTGWNFYAAVIVTTALVLYQTFSKNNYAGSVISGLVKMSALSFICLVASRRWSRVGVSVFGDICLRSSMVDGIVCPNLLCLPFRQMH